MSYYQCEAWQIEEDHEDGDEHDHELRPVFSIEIFANIASDHHHHHSTIVRHLLLPQDQLAHANSTSWSAISSKLSEMEVPFGLHATVMFKIIECARSAMNEAHNKNRKKIPIIVTLGPTRPPSSEDDALTVSDAKGASKRAIGSLKTVEVEGNSSVVQCVICLEEILDGFKAASQMPCSHVYHQDCILSWLEKSNLCPLCRFQLPT